MKNTWKWILGGGVLVVLFAVALGQGNLFKGALPNFFKPNLTPEINVRIPESPYVSRAELAKMLVEARGLTLLNPLTPSFSDVPRSHRFYRYIETAASENFFSGYPDGTFRPSLIINRAEFAVIVFRAFDLIEGSDYGRGAPYFSDVPEDAWFAEHVKSLYAIQAIKIQYHPSDPLERTFAREVIANMPRV